MTLPPRPMPRLPGKRPGPLDRAELLRLWDEMSPEARKMVMFVARAAAKEEGVLGPRDEALVVGTSKP